MRRFLVILLAVPLLAGCGSGGDGCDPDVRRSLEAWGRAGFSGTVTVATRGRVDCSVAFGQADPAAGTPNTTRTVFSLGSIAKAFTAAAVLELATAGDLSLDDRAGALVPELRGPAADVTVRQLLLHTGGLTGAHGNDDRPLSRAQALAAIGGLERAFTPGSDFLYSNAGYTLLALIVESVSGRPFREHLAARVLRRSDGRAVGGFWQGQPAAPGPRAAGGGQGGRGPYWAVDGNGGIAMTTEQLARWTYELFTGRIVSRRVAASLARPGFRHSRSQSEAPGWVVLDRSVLGQPVLASAGGGGDVGHDAIVAWLPESQRVIAAASNGSRVSAEQLLAAAGRELAAGRPVPAPRDDRVAVAPARLAALAGRYALPGGGSFRVTPAGGGLSIAASGREAIAALFPPPAGHVVHERAVAALLAGRTREGRKERAAIEAGFGRITALEVTGTVLQEGELRTYVDAVAGGRPVRLWFALDERGGVAAAEAPTDPPRLVVVHVGRGRFRPDAPAGGGPDVTVSVAGGRLVIRGRRGATVARLAD